MRMLCLIGLTLLVALPRQRSPQAAPARSSASATKPRAARRGVGRPGQCVAHVAAWAASHIDAMGELAGTPRVKVSVAGCERLAGNGAALD